MKLMKSYSYVALVLTAVLLVGCGTQSNNAGETPTKTLSCQEKPHVSVFREYEYEGPKKSTYQKKGYEQISPLSYTGSTTHTKKVIEQYKIDTMGISFQVEQIHSECMDKESVQYIPVMYNSGSQSVLFVTLPSDFSIQKLSKAPQNMKNIVSCGDKNRGIDEVYYIENGAVVKTTKGEYFLIGRGGETDSTNDGRSIADSLCGRSSSPNIAFVATSLIFAQ